MASLFGYCIHTFRHSDDLQKQQKDGGSHTLTEGKAWTTGRQLWIDAERAAERMPILFSGADVHTGLIYWAAIDDIVSMTRRGKRLARTQPSARSLRRSCCPPFDSAAEIVQSQMT
jgi:hypothetical protein